MVYTSLLGRHQIPLNTITYHKTSNDTTRWTRKITFVFVFLLCFFKKKLYKSPKSPMVRTDHMDKKDANGSRTQQTSKTGKDSVIGWCTERTWQQTMTHAKSKCKTVTATWNSQLHPSNTEIFNLRNSKSKTPVMINHRFYTEQTQK